MSTLGCTSKESSSPLRNLAPRNYRDISGDTLISTKPVPFPTPAQTMGSSFFPHATATLLLAPCDRKRPPPPHAEFFKPLVVLHFRRPSHVPIRSATDSSFGGIHLFAAVQGLSPRLFLTRTFSLHYGHLPFYPGRSFAKIREFCPYFLSTGTNNPLFGFPSQGLLRQSPWASLFDDSPCLKSAVFEVPSTTKTPKQSPGLNFGWKAEVRL